MPSASFRRIVPAFGLLLAVSLAGCNSPTGSGSAASGGAATNPAAQIYQQKCQFCHGQDGNGGGAPALTAAAGKPDAELRKVIQDGGRKMPAFKKQLTPEQIDAMVKHVQGLGKG
jgi:mono/diheme cytochrome c family protein